MMRVDVSVDPTGWLFVRYACMLLECHDRIQATPNNFLICHEVKTSPFKIDMATDTVQLHALILILGVFSSSFNLCSKLVTSYALCRHPSYASHLFDKLPQPSLFSWNAMMRLYVQMGHPLDVLNLFV
ncbi:hypothetical protein JHK85_030876 [Glycine max]|nr:hypothetical protein JHK85_030876 [Glycine max]